MGCRLDYEACAAGVKQVEADLGPVDVLVNNAGITRDGTFHRMTLEQWNAVISTNLDSLFNMTRPVIEGMRDAQVRPHHQHLLDQRPEGPDRPGQLFGRQGRRRSASPRRWRRRTPRKGITVNAICPGYIDTEMVQAVPKDVLEKNILPLIPVGRLGEPEEIARCVVFLAADDAGFITGADIAPTAGSIIVIARAFASILNQSRQD